MRPDVSVESSASVPLLIIEILSGTIYLDNLSKTIAVVVNQLRYLRNCDNTICRVSGFLFPSSQSAYFITEVAVEWKNMKFYVKLTPYSADDGMARVQQVLKEISDSKIPDPCTSFTILPLNDSDLQLFASDAKLIPSSSSIVVYSENKQTFWKCNVVENTRAGRNSSKTNVVVTRSGACDLGAKFAYVGALGHALNVLHNEEKLAHMDVRWQNTCYWQGTIKLIDFDRCVEVSEPANIHRANYKSHLYEAPASWLASQLDWKQLGFLVLDLCKPDSDTHNWAKGDPKTSWLRTKSALRAFLTALKDEGRWDQNLYQAWVDEANNGVQRSSMCFSQGQKTIVVQS